MKIGNGFLAFSLLSSLTLATAPAAWATMPVIDTMSISKLTDQLSALQKQIDALTDLKKKAQDQIDAIGKMGQITLPIVNAARLASQVGQDAQCLIPDFSKLMPSVDFQDVKLGSVCQSAPMYDQTLRLDPKKLQAETWDQRNVAVKAVQARRETLLADSATKGLALSDMATKNVNKTTAGSKELEVKADGAKTSQDRLAVVAKGQVLIARTLAQQNQILAQMLRIQAALALQLGVSVEAAPPPVPVNKNHPAPSKKKPGGGK